MENNKTKTEKGIIELLKKLKKLSFFSLIQLISIIAALHIVYIIIITPIILLQLVLDILSQILFIVVSTYHMIIAGIEEENLFGKIYEVFIKVIAWSLLIYLSINLVNFISQL